MGTGDATEQELFGQSSEWWVRLIRALVAWLLEELEGRK